MTTPEQFRDMLKGPVVAMTTPFNQDLSLDLKGLRDLVEFYCQSGIGPLIIAGSTGEFYSLTMEERKAAVEVTVDQAAGRLPVIAGCAHSGTQLTLELVQHAQEAGVDGAMITPPYYTFSGFEGLYRHYELITKESDLGVMVYFSGAVLHQVQDILTNPSLLYKICELPHIVGMKDASGNFWFHRDISIALKGKVSVIGSAGLGYAVWGWDYGSTGWITGVGNIWPHVEVDFYRALQRGDRETAFAIAYDKDRPYISYIKGKPKRYNYWAAVKALLDMEGVPGGLMRPPLLDWPKEDLPELRAEMVRIGLMDE